MTFDEAAQRFRLLDQQYTSGQITIDQYRSGLAECRVTDPHGRLWMPQERTGEWYVFLNNQWQPGSVLQKPQPVVPTYSTPPQPAYARPAAADAAKGGMRLGTSLIIWAVMFAILAVILYIATKEVMVFAGVGLAAAISLVIMLANANSAWEGQIYDIRTVTEQHTDSEGDTSTRRVTYAYLRLQNGKTKRVTSGRGWQVGDYIVKRKGEMSSRCIKQ